MTNEWYFTIPTQETYNHFKKGSWYKGINLDRGIIAKCSGNPESNTGWWSGTFAENFFRLITPSNFEEITDKEEIEKLEQKLKQEYGNER